MKNGNQLKIGSLLSYGQMFLGVVISLVYTPAMLDLLGQGEYGLYNTVASTISMLSLLSLGFNSGYIRYYSQYRKSNDMQAIWKLNGLFLMIFIIIGVVALGCGFFLSFHLEMVFSDGLTSAEYKTAKILMQLLTVNLALSFPMSVFSNIISAHEKFVFLKILSILKTVLGPLVTLPLLLAGFRSIAMVTVTLILSVVTDTVYMYYVFKKLNNRFVFHDFEKGLFSSLFVYTVFIAINMVVDQINWNVDKILLGRYKGTDAVAIYSVGYTLYQHYMMFSTSISSVFTPRIHRIVNDTMDNPIERREKLTDLFVKVGRIQFILLGLVASAFIFFGEEFITTYWAGSSYGESYYVALLLILPASIALIQNIGIEIQRAQDKHRFRAMVYTGMAIINVVISIVLCQKYGAVGSAVGTAISLIVANGLIVNIYYHMRCNVDVIRFWRSIGRLSLGLLIPVLCGALIHEIWVLSKWWMYVGCIVLYTLVYGASMWFVGMNQSEKALFSKPIKKVTNKLFHKT